MPSGAPPMACGGPAFGCGDPAIHCGGLAFDCGDPAIHCTGSATHCGGSAIHCAGSALDCAALARQFGALGGVSNGPPQRPTQGELTCPIPWQNVSPPGASSPRGSSPAS